MRRARDLRFLLFALPLLLTAVYFARRHSSDVTHILGAAYEPDHGLSNPTEFWDSAFRVLGEVKPRAKPVQLTGRAPATNWSPNMTDERPDLVDMSAEDELAMRTSHADFVKQIPSLARKLPFKPGTTGIVTTAGEGTFGQVVTLVLMARQAGSQLPIEVILDATNPVIASMCGGALKEMNATCIFLLERWSKLRKPPPKFGWFQWKIVAILASTFQNILFLDADTLPVLNPDDIFSPGAEPFASTGFITWPDFWAPSASRLFYQIAGDVPVPSVNDRTTSESGVMAVDKSRHADTVMLALYYNVYGWGYYYPLLSQGGAGEGDKETFLQAALVLDALEAKGSWGGSVWATEKLGLGWKRRSGHWDVKRMASVHGRSLNGTWRGMFMQQMDPVEDYRVVQASRTGVSLLAKPPPSVVNIVDTPTDTWYGDEHADEAHRTGKVRREVAEIPSNEMYEDRFMFFHHNGVKLDFIRILEENSPIAGRDSQGKYVRLWGNPSWVVQRTGRDVERELWLGATKIFCDTELKDVCNKLWEVMSAVI